MQYVVAALIVGLLAAPASAQQQMQIPPAQIAIGISNAVGQMALELEGARRQIQALQQENAGLKTKCGDACKDADAK